MRVLVATTNAGKLRDFAAAAISRVTIDPLPGLKSIVAPDEDEDTFEGNARIKAVYYSTFAPGEVVIADDSGLEVDALGWGLQECGLRGMRMTAGLCSMPLWMKGTINA